LNTKYQEDEYFSREYGDIEFYKWLSQIKHHSAAILAEMISAPRLSPHIESLRPEVKNMKTITIDEYRKIKRAYISKCHSLKSYGEYSHCSYHLRYSPVQIKVAKKQKLDFNSREKYRVYRNT
jgi:hypothetical protein